MIYKWTLWLMPACQPACRQRLHKVLAAGQLFEDTQARGKPIVFLYGARPFTGGLCEGVEKALAGMRAGG